MWEITSVYMSEHAAALDHLTGCRIREDEKKSDASPRASADMFLRSRNHLLSLRTMERTQKTKKKTMSSSRYGLGRKTRIREGKKRHSCMRKMRKTLPSTAKCVSNIGVTHSVDLNREGLKIKPAPKHTHAPAR